MALRPPQTAEQIDITSPPPPSSSSSLSTESQRFIPTPFLIKTYQLVDDVSINSIVSWNEDGKAFVVWNPAEFARDVLPKLFKHNNFSSFVRQLNTYGFRKIMPDRWEFSHDCFRKGNKPLLCDIVRRKHGSDSAAGAVIPGSTALNVSVAAIPAPLMVPSTSNSGDGATYSWNSNPFSVAAPFTPSAPMTALLFVDSSVENRNCSSRAHLIDENDRLKKKNTQLCKELSQMKSMCTNVFSMMSNYNPGSGPIPGLGNGPGPPPMLSGCGSHNSSQAESMMIPIRLMSIPKLLAAVVETGAGELEVIPERLSLNQSLSRFQHGPKRLRGEDGSVGEPVEQDDLLQLQQPGSSPNR